MDRMMKEYGMLALVLLIACLCFLGLHITILPQLKAAVPREETVSSMSGPVIENLASMQQPAIRIRPIHLMVGERKTALSFVTSLKNSQGMDESMDFQAYQMKQGRCVYQRGENRIVIECEHISEEGILEAGREQVYSLNIEYRDSYSRKTKERVAVLVTTHEAG